MQVSTAEFKKGLRIVFDGNPYTIVDFQHVKPGKGGAFVRTKLKHMKLGKVIDNTFRSGEKVELVDFEEKHMQFLYKDDRYNFMDTETYEQVSLSADEVGDAREYLKENTEVDVLYIEGSPAAVELPNFVELAIARTDPGVRGDTAQGGTKPATLETGAVVQVPLFLSEGDVVKVDTRTGEYLGRVADLVGRERDLLVRLGVHEVVAVVSIEELHVLLFEVDQLDLFAGPERVVDHLAESHVLELRADERAALARLHVLEVDDRVGIAIEHDAQSLLELGR